VAACPPARAWHHTPMCVRCVCLQTARRDTACTPVACVHWGCPVSAQRELACVAAFQRSRAPTLQMHNLRAITALMFSCPCGARSHAALAAVLRTEVSSTLVIGLLLLAGEGFDCCLICPSCMRLTHTHTPPQLPSCKGKGKSACLFPHLFVHHRMPSLATHQASWQLHPHACLVLRRCTSHARTRLVYAGGMRAHDKLAILTHALAVAQFDTA
jgi:hypothetical protein